MTNEAKCAAIIVAAGRGQRAGGEVPKQWRDLAGQTVAARTVAQFRRHPGVDLIVVVLHPDDMHREFPDATITAGGDTRATSVRAGLDALRDNNVRKVLIHDVARPLVSQRIISDVIAALDQHPGAAPALPVTDALWQGADNQVQAIRDRSGLFRAQTPQGFDYAQILAAHRDTDVGAADDVEIARAAGIDVAIVPGDEHNIKLTYPGDFARAEAILRSTMDIRTGNGFDVHRFGPGDHVTLCGIDIPHNRTLQGHSDADVAMHSLTDAIYGALAQGDIGRHFPPSDPQWKGADSAIFLRHAAMLARDMGFQISNLDLTLICEQPKITPHAPAMIARLAQILDLAPARISVKATTSERLGFTGREEGIAALAGVTLVTA